MAAHELYSFLLFLHLASVFGFLLVHGISIAIVLSLRRERNVERIRALLSLSRTSIGGIHAFALMILLTGLILGFLGPWSGRLWFWTAFALFVGLGVAMGFVGTRYYDRVRVVTGVEPFYKVRAAAGNPTTTDVGALLASPRPVLLTVVGIVVLLVILWLMMYKPF